MITLTEIEYIISNQKNQEKYNAVKQQNLLKRNAIQKANDKWKNFENLEIDIEIEID